MSHPCPAYAAKADGTVTWTCPYTAGEWRLCRNCATTLERNLGDLPALVEQLDLTLSRQVGQSDRVGGRGPEKPMAYNVGASNVLGEIKAVLVGWVRDLVESGEGRTPADTHQACALFLVARIRTLRVHPAAEEIAREVADVHRKATEAIDRPPVTFFAGHCEAVDFEAEVVAVCGKPLYARLGEQTAKCKCGARYDVEERRGWLLDAAQGYLLTKSDMIRAVAGLLGEDVSDARFRKWIERERLIGQGPDMMGRETYRVGDVLDLLNTRMEATG